MIGGQVYRETAKVFALCHPAGPHGDVSMLNIASEETYQDGQIIIEEGSFGDWVYVILSGTVEISMTVEGKKFIMTMLQPGQAFGELGFLGGFKRTATALAVGETTVGIIDREFLDEEFNRLSSDFRPILVGILERFKEMMNRTSEFTLRKEVRIQKTLSLRYKDKNSFVNACADNISVSGLFIGTENPLKHSSTLCVPEHLIRSVLWQD